MAALFLPGGRRMARTSPHAPPPHGAGAGAVCALAQAGRTFGGRSIAALSARLPLVRAACAVFAPPVSGAPTARCEPAAPVLSLGAASCRVGPAGLLDPLSGAREIGT